MTYRVGLIGTGPRQRTKKRGGGFAIGRVHANAWRRLDTVELVAACDIKADNLTAFAEDYAVPGRYADHRKMLADAELDVVDICTWPPLHLDMVVSSAEAGVKAIYCEKPMCLSLAEARRMVDTCTRHDVKLIVSHQRRFERKYLIARDWIRTGRIGEVLEIEARIAGDDADLLSWGTHWFDMFGFLLNDAPAQSVFAAIDTSGATQRYGHPVEDRALVSVVFAGGVRCTLDGAPEDGPVGLRVIGTRGMIHIVDEQITGQLDGFQSLEISPEIETDFEDSFVAAMADLIASVENNREPALSGRLAARTIEMIMAAYESANRRALIRLPLDTEQFPLLSRPEFQK
jgi:predicted dehydrogenase